MKKVTYTISYYLCYCNFIHEKTVIYDMVILILTYTFSYYLCIVISFMKKVIYDMIMLILWLYVKLE